MNYTFGYCLEGKAWNSSWNKIYFYGYVVDLIEHNFFLGKPVLQNLLEIQTYALSSDWRRGSEKAYILTSSALHRAL